MSFAILCRPVFLYFGILMLFYLAIKNGFYTKNFNHTFLILFIPASIISVQVIGMYKTHNYVGISEGSSNRVLVFLGGHANSIKNKTDIKEEIHLWMERQSKIVKEQKVTINEASDFVFKELRSDYKFYLKSYLVSFKYNILSGCAMAKSSFERNISKIQNVVYCTALFSTICLLVFKLVRKKISLNINFQLLIFTLLISIFIILTGAFLLARR